MNIKVVYQIKSKGKLLIDIDMGVSLYSRVNVMRYVKNNLFSSYDGVLGFCKM